MRNQNTAMASASLFTSTVIYFLVAVSILLTWFFQAPSEDFFKQSDATAFSQDRALAQLNVITEQPHYLGSDNHQQVREYLVSELEKLGLQVEVTRRLALSSKRFSSGYVHNIISRISGDHSTALGTLDQPRRKALLLMSHYDSGTHSSFGAADAGSGVVTILETVRAFLAAKHSHSNDIVIMFTDGEEEGLFGAEAFVAKHPWAKDIGLVLNFEARGSGGPSYMLLETNGGNQNLIDAFANAGVEYPVGNSLMYSIYKMLPNDTDLTVFREQANINGFNFAFIDDHFDYHTAQDTSERLDLKSLNHQASYLNAMLNYFKDADLASLDSKNDNVFFNFANLTVIHYPFSWVWPLFIFATLIWTAITFILAKQSEQPLSSFTRSALPAIYSVFFAGLLGYFGWQILLWAFPFYQDIPQGFTYNGHWLIATFILLTVSFTCWIYGRYTAKTQIRAEFLSITPILLWLLVNLPICMYLTGASFLIVLPLMALLALAWQIYSTSTMSKACLIFTVASIPGLVLFTPQIPVFVVGLGLSNMLIGTVMSALTASLLISGIYRIRGFKHLHWLLTTLALMCFAKAMTLHEYTPDRKKPNHLNYVYATDQKKAFLVSNTIRLDSFLSQYFTTENTDTKQIEDIYPSNRWRKPQYVKQVETLPMSATTYIASSKKMNDGRIELLLQLQPNRPINMLQLSADQDFTISRIEVDGEKMKRVNRKMRSGFFYKHVVSNQQPVTVKIIYSSQQKVQFRLFGSQYDLLQRMPNINKRADNLMPHPFTRNDATIISQPILVEP